VITNQKLDQSPPSLLHLWIILENVSTAVLPSDLHSPCAAS